MSLNTAAAVHDTCSVESGSRPEDASNAVRLYGDALGAEARLETLTTL